MGSRVIGHGDDAMRVFAAGTETNRMRIEVWWRSGKRSVVAGVRANREYEIDETKATEIPEEKPKSSRAASLNIPATR